MSTKEFMIQIGDKVVPLSSLRVVDLKEQLEKRALSKSGSKKDLADRLRNFIQLERQKEEPVIAADEEQLPNISMQEKLAEQNPFIRDYFASQAELFHSQKVAKKLIEEEARRESEASAPSADEGGENSAPEDPSLNSSSETESGKVKKLARRFENQSKDIKNKSEASVVQPLESSSDNAVKEDSVKSSPIIENRVDKKILEKELKNNSANREVEIEKQPTAKVISEVPKKIEIQENISLDQPPQIEMAVENLDPPKAEEVEQPKSASSASSSPSASSRSRSSSPEPDTEEKKPVEEKDEQKSSESSNSSSEDEDEGKESLIEKAKEANGNVKKLTEKFENQTKSVNDIEEKEVAQSPEPEPAKEKTSDSEQEKETDEDQIVLKSSPSRLRSPSPVQVRQQPERRGKRRSSSEVITKSPVKDADNKVRKLAEKFERKNSQESTETDKVKENDAKINEEIAKEEKNKADLIKRRERFMIKSEPNNSIPATPTPVGTVQVRKLSTRTEEIADDEVLDYGDEEKVKTEPAKFNWTRRILRLKSTLLPKKHMSKWRRDIALKLSENINSESMTEWFTEVKLVSASELRLEEKEKSPSTPPAENVEFTRKFSIDSEEGAPIKMENITITRKVSLIPMIKTEPDEQDDKDLSPSRNPESELILITNLVRPFTLPQLKELLQRTGNVQELWVDKIKSKCIAKYEQKEEAFETRAALHGVNWPLSNRKALHVDYTTQEVLDDYKARDAGDIKPVVVEKPVTAEILPVREWDVGKRAKSRSPTNRRKRSRSTSRERKRSRASPSSNRRRHSRSPNHDRRSRAGEGKEPEPLGKALDELFRKTTAIPSIYWLPLTPGQIAEKEELRRKRMLERERRLAEMNKNRSR